MNKISINNKEHNIYQLDIKKAFNISSKKIYKIVFGFQLKVNISEAKPCFF